MVRATTWLRAHLGTVRSRTTLAATIVVACALVLGSVVLVTLLTSSLEGNIETAAELRAADLGATISSGTDLEEIAVRDEEDSFVQVLDEQDRVILSSSNVEGEPAILPIERNQVATVDPAPIGEGTEGFRIVSLGVDTPEGPLRIIVGGSLEEVTQTTSVVARYLSLGVPGLLLIVGLTTWLLTGRALRPVEAIRAEVSDISAKDLGKRVAVPRTGDEIARLAGTMNEMLDRLSDSQRRQRRFISDASHELRSPITTIRHHAEVAAEHPGSTDIEDLAQTVLAEDARLEQLVEDLLVLARADERTLALSRRPIDLDDLALEEATRLNATTQLEIDISGISAARVEGDVAALTQMLRNLCDNAVRHALAVVRLEVFQMDGKAMLVVSDDGKGVPEEERRHIFERFTRLEEARDRDSGGSGLGLAITEAIVEAHGGSISVTDAPGGGARFEIILPSPPI